jgi:hypothetical protein
MSTPDESLNAELLDELISADLDGDLDRAAADLGLDLQAARAALDSPAARERRVLLARARDLLASEPRLDAAQADRLVSRALATIDTNAVTHLRSRRTTTAWRVVAGIAAAAAVVAGVVAIAAKDNPGASKSESAAAKEAAGDGALRTTTTGAARHPATGVDFGDVSQPGALQASVRAGLRRLGLLSASGKTAYATAPSASSALGNSALTTPSTTAFAANGDSLPAPTRASCVGTVRRADRLGRPLLSGSGTSGGRPVTVIVFAAPRGYVAYVVTASNCSVRTRTAVP